MTDGISRTRIASPGSGHTFLRGVPLSSHVIFRTWNDTEAELVRGLLESYGIPCQVISHITHSVVPLTVDGLGEIRLSVPEEAADEAREILEGHQLSALPRNLEIVGE